MYQQSPEPSNARILFGNANNFTRIRDANDFKSYYDRPLLVEAWSQTEREEFAYLDDSHRLRNIELETEIAALRERVQELEADLDVRQQLLEQIHATAGLKTVASRASDVAPTPPVTPIMQQQNSHNHHAGRRISPMAVGTTSVESQPHHAYGSSSLINTQMKMENSHAISTTDGNSLRYTIVANEQNENENCEPIEVQLAEDDGAVNLNNSTDSGRLEICLSADEQMESNRNDQKSQINGVEERQETKSPSPPPTQPPPPPQQQQMPAQSGILVKRRKISTSPSSQESQYYYNEFVSENAHTPSVICHSFSSNELPTSTSQSMVADNSRPSSRSSSDRTSSSNSQPMTPMPREEATPANVIHRHHQNGENVMVSIGPNNTRVPFQLYENINWDSPSLATRKLLMAVFDRQTLATHSMTGKPSPAFKGLSKPQKRRLDPNITEDIIFVVTRRCKVSDKEVRNAITTKCADENKMMKLKMRKEPAFFEANKENFSA